jgi:hypothetical protein
MLTDQGALDLLWEGTDVDWLSDVTVESCIQRPLAVSGHCMCGQGYHPNFWSWCVSNFLQQCEAVLSRKLNVHQDELGSPLIDRLQQSIASSQTENFVPLETKDRTKQLHVVRTIFYDQDPCHAHSGSNQVHYQYTF